MAIIQKSASFLLPTVLGSNPLYTFNQIMGLSLVSTYMLDPTTFPDEVWGEHLYLVFPTEIFKSKADISAQVVGALDKLVNRYEVGIYTVLRVKIPEVYLNSVVQPFLYGKYSLIDREYVKNYFPPFIYIAGKQVESTNYKILNKDFDLRTAWEDQLEISLPPDAEVWSRVIKEDETFALC